MIIHRKDEYRPTVKDIMENREQYEKCLYYGIRIGYFYDEKGLTQDELEALSYISANKEVPYELGNRLLNSKSERVSKSTTKVVNVSDKEIEDVFGIKF